MTLTDIDRREDIRFRMSIAESVVAHRAQVASALLKEAVSNTITVAQSRAVAAEARSVAGAACKSLSLTIEHLTEGMKHSSSIKKVPQLLSQQQIAEETQSLLAQTVQLNTACARLKEDTAARELAMKRSSDAMKCHAALASTVWMKVMEKR